ncbi:MAG TPA: PQQ-binding-like beta-propeller repeat protein [Candidatus Lokiarchaeia archaeon]|nr:PQQ-binding-like beta-propeller repeat protein [Candidatus Lokiarchaeia archaeon]
MYIHSISKERITVAVIMGFILLVSCSCILGTSEKKITIVTLGSTGLHPANAQGSSDQSGDEWPMFHGALNHTGLAKTTPKQGTGPIWASNSLGSVFSSPAVTGGRVYVEGDDNNVYCLNATTGAQSWSYTTGGQMDSSPAVAGGRVYVGNFDHKVYCLNATNGSKIWSYNTGGQIISSPAVAGGRVYIGDFDHKVYCLNATKGTSLWNYTTGNAVGSSPAISGGRLYVGSEDYKVYCLNATNGSKIWSYTTGDQVTSSPAVAGGRVYVGNLNNKVYCLDASTGAYIWNYTTGNYVSSSPAVTGGRVYVGSSDGKIYCLDATKGTSLWNYTTGAEVDSSPAVAGRYVYVGSTDFSLYCLDTTTGKFIWSYATGYYVHSSPAVAGGYVYVGSYDGAVYCLPMIFAPSITHPNDITYIGGCTGNNISWTITGKTTSNGSYTLHSNATPDVSGPWTSGTPVTNSIDGLMIGSYNYTIVATDANGGSVQDTVIVTVIPNVVPVITHPADITYVAGSTGNSISWTIIDATTSTRTYRIYRNYSSVTNGTWTSGTPVTCTVDGLSPGTYNYTIVAGDGLGGWVVDWVIITVHAPEQGPSQPTGLDPGTIALIIIIAACAAVVVTVGIIVVRKRRSAKKRE